MDAKAPKSKADPKKPWYADASAEPEDVIVPRPPLTDAERGQLAAALRELELHLSYDPEHPASGIAGVFPVWLKTIFRLQGQDILEFLQARADADAMSATEHLTPFVANPPVSPAVVPAPQHDDPDKPVVPPVKPVTPHVAPVVPPPSKH